MTLLYLCETQDNRSAPDSGPCRISANMGQNIAHCSDVWTAPLTRRDIEPPEGHRAARAAMQGFLLVKVVILI